MGATEIWNVLQTLEPTMGWQAYRATLIRDIVEDADDWMEDNPDAIETDFDSVAWLGLCHGIVLGMEFALKKTGQPIPGADELRKMRKGGLSEDVDSQAECRR